MRFRQVAAALATAALGPLALGSAQASVTYIFSEYDQGTELYRLSKTLADFLDDGFRPIARDGAGQVEVGMRLQRTLKALANSATPDDAETIRTAAEQALARANAALDDEGDLAAVRAAAG